MAAPIGLPFNLALKRRLEDPKLDPAMVYPAPRLRESPVGGPLPMPSAPQADQGYLPWPEDRIENIVPMPREGRAMGISEIGNANIVGRKKPGILDYLVEALRAAGQTGVFNPESDSFFESLLGAATRTMAGSMEPMAVREKEQDDLSRQIIEAEGARREGGYDTYMARLIKQAELENLGARTDYYRAGTVERLEPDEPTARNIDPRTPEGIEAEITLQRRLREEGFEDEPGGQPYDEDWIERRLEYERRLRDLRAKPEPTPREAAAARVREAEGKTAARLAIETDPGDQWALPPDSIAGRRETLTRIFNPEFAADSTLAVSGATRPGESAVDRYRRVLEGARQFERRESDTLSPDELQEAIFSIKGMTEPDAVDYLDDLYDDAQLSEIIAEAKRLGGILAPE